MKYLDIVNKSSKLRFVSRYILSSLKPSVLYRQSLEKLLEEADREEGAALRERVNYYNKLQESFSLDDPVSLKTLRHRGSTDMKMDFWSLLRYFDRSKCFNVVFGDKTGIPDSPSFIKARKIKENNQNSVILKLESERHFNFVNDPTPFAKKRNIAQWRGAAFNRPLRNQLLRDYLHHPKCDVGDTNLKKRNEPTYKPFISFSRQLENKFLISLEGNDVATNTKWIMSSNSLCFMPRPRKETWFMEGLLKPDYHYVLLKDDFSNLEERIDHFSANPEQAMDIIANAHRFVAPFRNRRRERLIGLLVVKKYLDLCLNNFN